MQQPEGVTQAPPAYGQPYSAQPYPVQQQYTQPYANQQYIQQSYPAPYVQYPTPMQNTGYMTYQQPVGTVLVSAAPVPYMSCCTRYNRILWGSTPRRLMSLLALSAFIIGIVLLSVSGSSCPSGCVSTACNGVDGNTYDCTCNNGYCKDKTLVGATASAGIALLNIGILYFIIAGCIACCCWRSVTYYY